MNIAAHLLCGCNYLLMPQTQWRFTLSLSVKKAYVVLNASLRPHTRELSLHKSPGLMLIFPSRVTMMTSSNGNIFRVTGHLCGEFTGHRWIPGTKASDAELWCFLWSAPWINGWVNNREAGDLRRHHAHYDVIVMTPKRNGGIRYVKTTCFWIFNTEP